MPKTISIIGGGAAGFFSAINIAKKNPSYRITIYEASNNLLSKVLISGGGRCNVTNTISDPKVLVNNYPRGFDFLGSVFNKFTTLDTQKWFTKHGVNLKTESDGRVFPATDSSETIYKCLYQNCIELGVNIKLKHRLIDLTFNQGRWHLKFKEQHESSDIAILATGINSGIIRLLEKLSIPIIQPVPSLFTFNSKNHKQLNLSGISVSNALVSINELPNRTENGSLLITHWGYSGPSILKLSSWLAFDIEKLNYDFNLSINWNSYDLKSLEKRLFLNVINNPKQKVRNWNEHGLPKRLWQQLFDSTGLKDYVNWSEIGKKGIDKLISILTKYEVRILGKTTYKEEFVTAGGINLGAVDVNSFSIKNHSNLYAVGELLNIDAVTGGFNFQAAWSGAYILSEHLSNMH